MEDLSRDGRRTRHPEPQAQEFERLQVVHVSRKGAFDGSRGSESRPDNSSATRARHLNPSRLACRNMWLLLLYQLHCCRLVPW